MSKVLIVTGTPGIDADDMCKGLSGHGVECKEHWWNELTDPPGTYDLAVLFGLDERDKNRAHTFATRVRECIGPDTKLLIVTGWNQMLFGQEKMKEKYGAEYMSRGGAIRHMVEKALSMLAETKAAP